MSKKLVKSLLIVLAIAMLLSAIAPAMANIQDIEQPRLDEIFFKVISDPDAATSAFQQCEVDVNPDMIRWANVQKMINEGNTVLAAPGFHYCYIGMNCRSYVPSDAGQPDAGRHLAPLNWTDFRAALAWAGLSEAEKAAAILQIYGGPINTACNTPVPPSIGVWHDPTVVAPGCNFSRAEEELLASGFTIVAGKLVQPNGEIARDEITVYAPVEAPTSCAFTQKWVDKWNQFFGTFLGVTNCHFTMDAIPFNDEVLYAYTYRNFDLYFLCYGLGRSPDYLYWFFDSANDYPDGDNSYGIHDPVLDALLETLMWGIDYQEKIDACHAAQQILVLQDVPAVYLYSRTYYNAFKNYNFYTAENKYLTNVINQAGYGADNGWTWGLMHWNTAPEGGSVNMILGAALATLHPGWYTTAYEADIEAKIQDGLIATTPNLGDLPWIACAWSVDPFVSVPLNVDGIKVRFQIRSDVKWHDGVPLTIQDVKFAMDYMKNFPRLQPVWTYYVWSQIVDPCTIDIYMNTTSQWILYNLAGIATEFPKHIYDRPDSVNAPLWTISYEDWTGNPPPAQYPFMKALIGCGPYVFDYWDPANNIAHVVKFLDYWVDGPLKQNFIQPQKVDPDTDFNYYVEVVNTGSKDITTGALVPATIDYIEITLDGVVIDIIDGPIVIAPFDYIVLGPYTMVGGLPKGPHYLDCHTYEEGVDIDDYICPVYVTIKEDTDNNFIVNFLDAIILGAAFGSQPGPALPPPAGIWDERADIDGNHFVNFLDAIRLGAQFGWDP